MNNHNLKVVARRLNLDDVSDSYCLEDFRNESRIVGFEEGTVAEALFILFNQEEEDVLLAVMIAKGYSKYLEDTKLGKDPSVYGILREIHGGPGHRLERAHHLLMNYLVAREREYKNRGEDAALRVA